MGALTALRGCVVAAVLAIAAPAQAVGVLDPTGVLAFDVDGERYELRFPELGWPTSGEHELGADGLTLGRVVDGGFEAVATGRISVETLDAKTAKFAIRGDGTELDVELRLELRRIDPPAVGSAPAELRFPMPTGRADGDLTICAIGSAGTGLPGQRRVADSIRRLAKVEGLDFVLLLGDLFAPNGVRDRSDPRFQDRFERVYPMAELPMPFYVALGDAEHRGEYSIVQLYAGTSPRLVLPAISYGFERAAGAVSAHFVAVDTTMALGSVRHPLTRIARSRLAQILEESTAGWRIAFGHHPLHSHADNVDQPEADRLRSSLESWMERLEVDLYVSGGAHALELIGPKSGVLHLSSGAAGGPEFASSVEWADDTIFAATGGGSAWLRIRPELLEITFRGTDGEVLFVHRVEKPR